MSEPTADSHASSRNPTPGGAAEAPPGRRARGRREWTPRRRAGKHADSGHELGVVDSLAALSLDALSSVAYGPEAMMVVWFWPEPGLCAGLCR